MKQNRRSGLFVAFEGPHGVGKSTLMDSIAEHLQEVGYSVLNTREPTDSELGGWIRERQGVIGGRTLACLVAANRYEHIESIIQPALSGDAVVLTDRYLASSFVYQISDAVPLEFIWSLNSQCLIADLTICLIASPRSISERLEGRTNLTRFEQSISPEQECTLYRFACAALRSNGWLVEEHVNEDGRADEVAADIARRIAKLWSHQYG